MPGDKRGYSWPPFQPGHVLSLRHGARSKRTLRPMAEEMLASLAEVAPWTTTPAFAGVAESWAYAEAACRQYREHLDELGLVDDDGNQTKALEMWQRTETRAQSLRAELGLTPAALAKLLGALSSIDGPAAQGGLDALRAAGAALRSGAQRGLQPAPDPGDAA